MMAKRRRRSSSNRNSKVDSEDGDQHISIDRISTLPDELLVSILARLTVEELAATSILSRRWRSLWTLVPKLDFDGTKLLSKIEMAENQKLVIHEERSKYVKWVDGVIAEHKSCAIEDFRVHFNLTKLYSGYIDKWVKYALDRKVKRLEMDLTHASDVFSLRSCCNCYTFPYKFLHQYKENSPNSIHFKYLEKICMTHVNVNGEALEFFLSNCPLLQHLSVSESKELSTLKIIGPFPSLKRLEIVSCLNLDSIEIRDANLVYLKYIGENIQQFVLKNVPYLAEIYTGGTMRMTNVVSMFSSILPQLEKFKLVIGCWLSWEETEILYSAVKMSNLKQLIVSPYFEGSLLPLSNIIRASPCLETFVLEIPLRGTRFRRTDLVKKEGSYTTLKNVKFIGYCGSTSDLEFVIHLSESAGALEKIVINPCKPVDIPSECFWKNNYEVKNSRKRNASGRAKKQLVGKLPPRINLQIL